MQNEAIQRMEKIFIQGVNKSDIGLLHMANGRILYKKGEYDSALQ